MSLKKTALTMALTFAATKGYRIFQDRGGMAGVKDMLAKAQSGGGGGLSGLLGGGTGGGLAGMLGGAAAGGGLLGGLTAMAGGDADTEPDGRGGSDDETAAVMIRAIGQAVRADGVLDADERAVLDEILGEADSPEDQAVIDMALSEPVDPEALALEVPRGAERQVYAAALSSIDPDHPAEQAFLARFSRALRLDPAERADLHAAAGRPAP